ncbi:endolytic murein transglycosylase [Spirochaetota bacterium]|nr:endolytic murein transglycosylase [Spirochaetota bacterium]
MTSRHYYSPFIKYSLLLLAFLVIAALISALSFTHYNSPPTSTKQLASNPHPTAVTKPSSTTKPDHPQPLKTELYTFGALHSNFIKMEQDGIIKSAPFALFLTKILGYEKKIKKGTYRFSNLLSTYQILNLLVAGREESVLFTIVEGYDLYDIDNNLFAAGLIPTKGQFAAYSHQKKTLAIIEKELDFPPALRGTLISSEGFLYPNSYQVRLSTVNEDLTRLALAQFKTTLVPILINHAPPEKWIDLMKISSLIEKETFLTNEKPLIASVLYNRLRINMKLRYDPTIIYALKKAGLYENYLTSEGFFDIKKEHFTFTSPYNTYTVNGLPQTPISSFTLTSLNAALNPAESPYLFFVARSRTDLAKGHDFSRSYEEHLEKIEAYQR